MNTKHYLTTILIFGAFLLGLSGNAQNSSDTIRMEKRGLGSVYYYNNKELNFKQVKGLTKENQTAYNLMQKADTLRIASYIFGVAGGVSLGFSLGHAIGRAMVGNTISKPLFFSTLGVGVALIGIGIGFEVGAKKKAKEGIAVYNNAIRQSNSKSLDLGFSPGCIMLKLSF